MVTRVQAVYGIDAGLQVLLPLFLAPVPAGFPSPADDFVEKKLDLNEHLIRHPAANFFVKAFGHSMIGAGIHSGDLLIVDRSLEPTNGSVVVAVIDGELTVKRLRLAAGRAVLAPENSDFTPLTIGEEARFEVWGVVTNVIHPM